MTLFPKQEPKMLRVVKRFDFNGFKYQAGQIGVFTEDKALQLVNDGFCKEISNQLPF